MAAAALVAMVAMAVVVMAAAGVGAALGMRLVARVEHATARSTHGHILRATCLEKSKEE